jgi:hypothetical protein
VPIASGAAVTALFAGCIAGGAAIWTLRGAGGFPSRRADVEPDT